MHPKTAPLFLFVIFWCWLAAESVIAATPANVPREKRASPMDIAMNAVAIGVDMIQQGVAGGHAGTTAIGTMQITYKSDFCLADVHGMDLLVDRHTIIRGFTFT